MTDAKPTGPVRARMAAAPNLSRGESAVALWVERHFDTLPFATAADLADGAGVSEMTVGRFVKRLGYENFKAFKSEISKEFRQSDPVSQVQRERRIAVADVTDAELQEQLRRELDAIVEVYQLATTETWRAAVDVVAAARTVNVTGFQGVKGMAMDFATRLKYARPGARFTDGRSGNWSEIFIEEPETSCVIMVDVVPYAHDSVKIADLCRQRGIPLIVVTDRYSAWPRRYTPHVLSVTTATNAFLDSTSGLSALLGLFLNALTARLGREVTDRLQAMGELTRHFDPFTYDPDSRDRPLPNIDETQT
ncbi:MurR/RpiR family transcriptional regulator [Lutimaribacter marinistellae]|uniref:MurR/RpiR family transcriptional regulator n=1 Tax=Lutimaribacter marinistellae TaxID=1820329 RepID=A0ABV7TD01_9RHOB